MIFKLCITKSNYFQIVQFKTSFSRYYFPELYDSEVIFYFGIMQFGKSKTIYMFL